MDEKKFVTDARGLWMMIVGLAVIVLGFVLLTGGGVEDPEVFNYEMFNFRRLVLAPVVIVAGIVFIIVTIVKAGKR